MNAPVKDLSLVRFDAMVIAIEQCHAIDEVKEMHNQALAFELYARQSQNFDAERKACEIRIRAERRIGQLLNELKKKEELAKAQKKVDKDAFILMARLSFDPGEREPCQICGLHKAVTQAHHLTPLSVQAERNYYEPDQSFAWLCPTHHVAIHIFLNHYFSKREFLSSHAGDVLLMMTETHPWEQYENFLRLLPGFDPKKQVEI